MKGWGIKTVIIAGIFLSVFLLFYNRKTTDPVITGRCSGSCLSLEFHSSFRTTIIKRHENGWLVSYRGEWFPGDKTKISKFIRTIKEMRKYATAGYTDDVWESFGVDPGNALSLVWQGLRCRTKLFFGRRVRDSRYIFMRENNDPKTYEVIFPSPALFAGPFYWMELRVFSHDFIPSSVISLTFYRGSVKYALFRKIENGISRWELFRDGKITFLGNNQIRNYLQNIIALKADGLVLSSDEKVTVQGKLIINLSSGKVYDLVFYKNGEGRILFKTNRSNYLYTLPKSLYPSLFPSYLTLLNSH